MGQISLYKQAIYTRNKSRRQFNSTVKQDFTQRFLNVLGKKEKEKERERERVRCAEP